MYPEQLALLVTVKVVTSAAVTVTLSTLQLEAAPEISVIEITCPGE